MPKINSAGSDKVKAAVKFLIRAPTPSVPKAMRVAKFSDKEVADPIQVVHPHKLKDIINIDETCLSLDDSANTRGGRPSAYFHHLVQVYGTA